MSLTLIKTLKAFIFMTFSFLFIVSCSDDDKHSNTLSFTSPLSASYTVPQVTGSGSGTATIEVDLDTNAISGTLTVSGLTDTATSVHIHNAIAGTTGAIVLTLEQVSSNTNVFNIPASSTLSNADIIALQRSDLYFNVHTSANPAGEIRGQIIADGYDIIRTELNGESQIPNAVDTLNTAIAFITLNTSTGSIRGNIKNTGLDDATAIHLHNAFAGANGGVVTTLEQDSSDVSVWAIADNTTLSTDELINALAGGLYFNVHTPANPTGELRGQVIPSDITLVRTELTGEFQVPTPVISAGSATGYLTVNEVIGSIKANIVVDNLPDVTSAHIHSGFAGTNGAVVITLTQDTTVSELLSSSDSDSFNSGNLTDFLSGKLYFNVHTTTNASGDVRGQIAPRNIVVTRDELDGSQSVPAVATSATGIGYTTFNTSDNSFQANIRNTDLTATAAHVHQGAVGETGGVILSLSMDTSDTDFWSASASLSSEEADALSSDQFYFNVHSDANASGEIRSQINQ